VALAAVEEAALAEIDRVRQSGVTPAETVRALRQLKARLVFETDSVTNIAHQLGYFETVAGAGVFHDVQRRIQLVTAEQVSEVARRRLDSSQLTVGWFRPQEPRP
jgi:zinc protease